VKKARKERDDAMKLAEKNHRKAAFYEAELERAKAHIHKLETEEREFTLTKTTVEHKSHMSVEEMQEMESKEESYAKYETLREDGTSRSMYGSGKSSYGSGKGSEDLSQTWMEDQDQKKTRRLSPDEVKEKRKRARAEKSPLAKSLKFLNLRSKTKRDTMSEDWERDNSAHKSSKEVDLKAEGGRI